MDLKRAKVLALKTLKLSKIFAKENGFPESLCGMCCISSVSLYMALRVEGFPAKIIYGKTKKKNETQYFHVWVTLDGKIFDVTFKQFNTKDEIFIGETTPYHEAFTEVKEVENLSEFDSWTITQVPTEGRLNWFTTKLLGLRNLNEVHS